MKKLLMPLVFILCAELLSSCAGMAASAEEYYSIGMAYFELGKFEEAEIWLNRAKSADKTMVASQYNLGRLAFEKKQYNEAARLFEGILKKDPDNILALKAAAYTRINTGDLETAEKYYARLQELIPESADNGYNHALVLYAMKRYSDAEEILKNYFLSMLENSEMQLLFARCQKAQNKIEAIDSYSNWLNNNSDVRARYEYAQLLELHELYARSIEEYRKALSETSSSEKALNREIRFSLAKLLLIADNESREGITELQTAVNDGFNNIEALENLLVNEKISAVNKDSIRNIISGIKR
ncbi:MAG: tetratricopeptide repeat protein [Brevinematales bacterium]|nr:tetratricopeptide repeat protein [Brevinematales bacterium]